MEVDFLLPGLQADTISVWDASALARLSALEFGQLRLLLEEFGVRSAAAQGLRASITDVWRLRSSEQQLYLHMGPAAGGGSGALLLGGLKVGRKKLFLHRGSGAIVEVEPLCVLDFYVAEEFQRQGVGHALFEHMLALEQLVPAQLGYDKPSPKLLAFLRKHYGLADFVPQNNNFVVFEQFFSCQQQQQQQQQRSPHSRRAGEAAGASPHASASWGPGAPAAAAGNGRQTLHVIGARASVPGAAPSPREQWVPTSLRPPTPSLQRSVQLHPSSGGGGGGGSASASGGSSPNASSGGCSPPWATGGGSGCRTAGVPTHQAAARQAAAWGALAPPPDPQLSQGLPELRYGRGQGLRDLIRGEPTGGSYSHAAYEAALLAAAANPLPAPPRHGGGCSRSELNAPTQQQQQQQHCGAASSRDALDALVCGGSTCWDVGASYSGHPGGRSSGRYGQPAAATAAQQHGGPIAPFGCVEPQPGTLLPSAADGKRVSLRRQAAQQAVQQQRRALPAWAAAGAGPPGKLLAAPTASYAVPTAAMAEVLCGDSSGRRQNELCLSWDGLLPPALQRSQQQHYQSQLQGWRAQPQQPGQLSRSDSGGWAASGPLEPAAKAAAATHRAGSGAASCLRMV